MANRLLVGAFVAALVSIVAVLSFGPNGRTFTGSLQYHPDPNAGKEFDCGSIFGSVPASRVGDGIIDCCNGADEGMHDAGPCREAAEKKRDAAAARYQNLRKAWRAALVKQSHFRPAHQREEWARQLEALASQIREIRSTMNEVQFEAPPQEMIMLHQQLMVQYRLLTIKIEQDYGEDDRLFPLAMAECAVSPTTTEKSLKGGSANVVQKSYTFEVCPFAAVTQREVNPHQWRLDDHLAHYPHRSVQEALEVLGEHEAQPIVLGFFQEHRLDKERGLLTLAFGGGAPCRGGVGVAAAPRTVEVQLSCGKCESGEALCIESAAENGLCEYSLEGRSPFACGVEVVEGAKEGLEGLERDVKMVGGD